LCLQSMYSTDWATPLVHFALVVWKRGLMNYLPGLASNLDPPDLNLPNSQD
jgi:hypothetical protein